MVSGVRSPYVGSTPSIPRLNIPALYLQDGPQGVGDQLKEVTFWPCTLAMVASWDLNLMYKYAEGIGWEQKKKGVNVHLGPMVNIARNPVGGRNFESFGEDPFLSSQMVVPYVQGIQSNNVMATVKHFVDNNQEFNRTLTSANVPQRAQWEIYYPAFKAAVDAGVASAMCSYNRINDTYACENDQTLNKDLKNKMGFKGFVMSDWGATHSTEKAAINGLDQEMPDSTYFGAKLKDAIQNGRVPVSRLDDMVVRIFTAAYSVGIMDHAPSGNSKASARNSTHDILTRTIATQSTVLLKNLNNLLPLSSSFKKIALIGDDATKPLAGGRGSGHVVPPYIITPLQGISKRAGPQVSVKSTGSADLAKASQLAAQSDVAIVFVSTSSSEGYDRKTLSLGVTNDKLVEAVRKSQKKTVVVAFTPGAVLMPWESGVPAIVLSIYPGQECGNALAAVLFGDYNPSGKIPVTFPQTDSQVPASTPSAYPGINNEASYSEGLLVGYRWYDSMSMTPLFPFGHGLSYTVFNYTDLSFAFPSNSVVQFSFNVTNAGTVEGSEVAQLYLGFPEGSQEPPQVLKGFQKVNLKPLQSSRLTINVSRREFSIWSVVNNNWQDTKGDYNVFVGSSSRDIRLSAKFSL